MRFNASSIEDVQRVSNDFFQARQSFRAGKTIDIEQVLFDAEEMASSLALALQRIHNYQDAEDAAKDALAAKVVPNTQPRLWTGEPVDVSHWFWNESHSFWQHFTASSIRLGSSQIFVRGDLDRPTEPPGPKDPLAECSVVDW